MTVAFNVPRGDIVMTGVTDSGSGYRGVVMLIGRESGLFDADNSSEGKE